jgi:quercetin dioxygenase-like cupin family protein
MNKTRLVALAWGTVSLAGVTAAVATPPSGQIARTELAVGKVTDEIDIQRTEPTDFHIHELSVEAGASSGWHTHPGPEYSLVKAGSVLLQRAPDCEERTIAAGQGFFIPGGTPHMAHNVGKDPTQMYVTYTVPAGTTVLRVDADEPCGGTKAPAKDGAEDAPAKDAPAKDAPGQDEGKEAPPDQK